VRLPHDQRVSGPDTPGDTPGESTGEGTGESAGAAPADGPGAAPGCTAPLALVAAIAYCAYFLEHLLSPSHDSRNAYVSELSATDQPYHGVYSGGDFATGVLAIAVALIALSTLRRRPWSVLGWTCLALFGLCAIGDAVFPLECAPSLDTRCALLERAGRLGFAHSFHAVTSSLVIVFGVAALLALSTAARRYGWWPALARWGLPLAATETLLASGTVTAMMLGRWLGIIQRVQIAVLVAGLLTIAWALHADRRHAARRSPAEARPPRPGPSDTPSPDAPSPDASSGAPPSGERVRV
jgi:hypothetical protein